MPSSLPLVHVGDDIVQALWDKCYPIIESHETNPDFKFLVWAQLCAYQGATLQRYFDLPAEKRIQRSQYETGQKLIEGYPDATNPFPEPSFNNVHPFPLTGVVGVNGLSFHDASGPRYPMGIHAGDLFLCQTEGANIETALDAFVEAGYHFTRQWITLMYYKQGHAGHFWGTRGCSPEITPQYWEQLESNVEMHIERKLKMHLSMGDLNDVPMRDLEQLYERLGDLVKKYGQEHFIFPGEINESLATAQQLDGATQARLVDRIRRKNPDILYALTATGGYPNLEILGRYTAEYQKVYYKHGYRDGHYWDKLRHYFSDGYEYYNQIRDMGADHEPMGVGHWVSVTRNMHEVNAAVMGLVAVISALSRQSFLYFCSPGIKWDEPFNSMPGFNTAARLVAMIPNGLCEGVLHHCGTSWIGTRVFSAVNEFRVDGQLHGNQFAYVCYGPGDRIRLPVNKSFNGQIINPSTLEVSSISGNAGEHLPEIGYDSGFVLTGELK